MADPDLDVVIDALAHVIGADRTDPWVKNTQHDYDYRVFDGFEPLAPSSDNDDFILVGGVNDRPVWPMDVAFAGLTVDGEGLEHWAFARIATLQPKRWRGRLRIVTPVMYESYDARVERTGFSLSAVSALAVCGGRLVDALDRSGRFRADQPGDGAATISGPMDKPINHDAHKDHEPRIAMAHGFALRRQYMWSVLLGSDEGTPRARFMTDPVGAREAFRLRDLPPGKERRAALRHWVRSHWRKRRDLDEPHRAWVREHLRGAENFTWNGLRCQISPSGEDMAKAMRAKSA